jgi:ABC transporter substrate binding protein
MLFSRHTRRREFITLLGGTAVWPLAARGQQPAMPVIGYISSLTQGDSVQFDAAFRRGLSEMGYVEGQNVRIEYRGITDRYSSLPEMATDLVQRKVTMIGAFGPPAVLAAKAATATIPIVFVTGADPVKFGFVASFNRPGGATQTRRWFSSNTSAKRSPLQPPPENRDRRPADRGRGRWPDRSPPARSPSRGLMAAHFRATNSAMTRVWPRS